MSSIQKSKRPYHLFYSYADEDAPLLNKLEKHLSSLKQLGEIQDWAKRNISVGNDWEREVNRYMNKSSIILLLISHHYIASDYYYGREMAYAIQRSKEKKAIIIPIILRPCVWDLEEFPFRKYEVLPSNKKPVTEWGIQDKAFQDIAQGIRKAVQNLREYELELKVKQLDPSQYRPFKSIRVAQVNPEPQETNKVIQTGPRSTSTEKNINRKSKTNLQGEAQIAEPAFVPVSWKKKPLPKNRNLLEMRTTQNSNDFQLQSLIDLISKCFSRKEASNCTYGNSVFAFIIYFFLDVISVPVIIWLRTGSPQLPLFIAAIALILFVWGLYNISNPMAIILSFVVSCAWSLIISRYVSLPQTTIIAIVLGLTCFHLFLFRKHKKRGLFTLF